MVKASQTVRAHVDAIGEGVEFSIADVARNTGASRQTVAGVLRSMVKTGELRSEMRPYRRHILQEIFVKPVVLPGAYLADYHGMDIMGCDDGRILTQSVSAGVLQTQIVSKTDDIAAWMIRTGLQFRTATPEEVFNWFDNAGILAEIVGG